MGFWHILAVFRKGVVFLSFYHPLPSFILQYWPPRWCALERLRPAICQAAGVGKGPSDALGSSDAASNGWTFETAPCSHGHWIQELQCALCRAIQSACWSLNTGRQSSAIFGVLPASGDRFRACRKEHFGRKISLILLNHWTLYQWISSHVLQHAMTQWHIMETSTWWLIGRMYQPPAWYFLLLRLYHN